MAQAYFVSVTEEIQWHRLRYFGHPQRMDKNVWPKRVNDYVVSKTHPRGHPQLRWSDAITKDLKDLNIRKELADEWVERRSGIMPTKYSCKECTSSEVDKHYKQWVNLGKVFGYPMVNFGPLLRGQPHSHYVIHCIFSISKLKVTRNLANRNPVTPSGIWTRMLQINCFALFIRKTAIFFLYNVQNQKFKIPQSC